MDTSYLLLIDILVAILGFFAMIYLVPKFAVMFDEANLIKTDIVKPGERQKPDALGVIAGLVFVICMVIMTPFLYLEADLVRSFNAIVSSEWLQWIPLIETANEGKCFCYYRKELIPYFATLFCISLMTLFGFVDDVLVLKRRRKFFIPAIASLPIVMFYFTSLGNTTMTIPSSLRWIFGNYISFGPFYYLFICILASFCANSLELLSSLDGLSVGQSLIINISIILLNLIEMNGPAGIYHRFSLYFMIPFLGVSSGLFHYNRYPSKVFPGDTYAYTAGMVFAVVAILGHFTEMLLLFYLPQMFNLVYSLPQILRYLPYPRRRSPKFNIKIGCLIPSKARIKKIALDKQNKRIIAFLEKHGLMKVDEFNESAATREFNNLTLENLILLKKGPMTEEMLTRAIMFIQILSCTTVFFFRYGLLYAVLNL